MHSIYTNRRSKNGGFTLIELIVSLGLFGLLSVLVSAAFVNILSIQSQAEAKQEIINDFRVALDLMGKEITAGDGFPQAEDGATLPFQFSTRVRVDMPRRVIHYKIEDGRIMKAQQDTQGDCEVAEGSFPPECFVPFSSDRVDVHDLTFYVQNHDEDDYGHPIVIITASGRISLPNADPSFQTSVSYSPRSTINPDHRASGDTVRPEVEIQFINGDNVIGQSSYDAGPVDEVDIEGEARDPGGSGISQVRILNLENGYSETDDSYSDTGTDPVDWEFDDVELVTGGVDNRIRVTATDESGNSRHEEIIVTSQADPNAPAAPSYDLSSVCSGGSFSHVRVENIQGNGDDNLYDSFEIRRCEGSGCSVNSPAQTDVISESQDEFNDSWASNTGTQYEYAVFAVNTEWDPGNPIYSDPTVDSISIASDACEPSTPTSLSTDLMCEASAPNPEEARSVSITVNGQSDASFEVDKLLGTPSVNWPRSGGMNTSEYTFTDNGGGSGLDAGTHSYEARACIGSVCSDPTGPSSEDVTSLTCYPPDALFGSAFDPEEEVYCAIEGEEEVAALDVYVDHVDHDDLRPFTDYIIEEDIGGSWEEVGSCEEDTPASGFCDTLYYTESGTHDLRIRTYSSNYDLYGDPSGVEPVQITIEDACGIEPLDEDSIVADLQCDYENSPHREAEIGIASPSDTSNTTVTYKVYECSSTDPASCDTSTVVAECDWDDRNDCGSYNLEDGEDGEGDYYYRAETCDRDGNNCSDLSSIYGELTVDEGQCMPQIPEITNTNIDQQCVGIDDNEQKVALSAETDFDESGVSVDIYRDGAPIATIEPGETYEFDEVSTGTYDYGFQACNSNVPDGDGCGEMVTVSYDVVELLCDPTVPQSTSTTLQCELEEPAGVEVAVSGSQYNDGYEIQRDGSLICRYEEGEYSAEDCFDGDADVDGQSYTYNFRSYREEDDGSTTYSEWDQMSHTVEADDCEPPFVLDTAPEDTISVSITGSGGTQTSETTSIKVEPDSNFGETVNFDADDVDITLFSSMDGVIEEEDIDIRFSRDSISSPYEETTRFSVEIPDTEDYFEDNDQNSTIGARFNVVGISESGFENSTTVYLEILRETGTTD